MNKNSQLPIIQWNSLKLFFISDYFDIPLKGLAYFQNQLVHFSCTDDTLFTDDPIYLIEHLSQEELQYQLSEKHEFENNVGTHWSFDENGNPLVSSFKDQQLSKEYFDKQKLKQSPSFQPRIAIAFAKLK